MGCKGCYNKELWSFIPIHLYSPKELFNKIKQNENIEGITLTGGEPLLQHQLLIKFLKLTKKNNLSVVCFTGFNIEEIRKQKINKILKYIDILIAGPYIEELKIENSPLISSSNQKMLFLSDTYSYKDISPEIAVEVFIDDKEIQVTGFPNKKFLEEVLF